MSPYADGPLVPLDLVGQDIRRSRMPHMRMREAAAQGLRCIRHPLDLSAPATDLPATRAEAVGPINARPG